MNSFLKEIKAVTSAILLISPPSMRRGEWVQSEKLISESKKLGALYGKLAESLELLYVGADDWQVDLSFDGVHFTEEGHASFAEGLKRTLRVFKSSPFDGCSK